MSTKTTYHEYRIYRNVTNVSGSCLGADVEVAVDGQHGVVPVPHRLGEQLVAAGLQEPLQEELGRGGQQGLLAVRGAHVLRRVDGGRVLHLLDGLKKRF